MSKLMLRAVKYFNVILWVQFLSGFFDIFLFYKENWSKSKKHEDTVKTTYSLQERPKPGLSSGQERLFPLARPLGARRTNCGGTEETSDLAAIGVIAGSRTEESHAMNHEWWGDGAERAESVH